MDLRKAFDTVSHKILLYKLHHYGIRGPAYALVENYLTSRNQFVTFSNTSSSTKPINIGVPQGSILGPLLFLIYINNLPNAINSTPRLFTDEPCLILQQSSLSALEKACSDKLIQLKWCDANKIQINLNKSFFFFIFISIFILLTRRKATEALIHRVDNYPDLLPEMPRYCYPLVN